MNDLVEYRRTSLEFRRLASNMLRTNYEEGNLHLIRLRTFIQENELIKEIIQRKIANVAYDYKDNFISSEAGWNSFNIPIEDAEHIKAMYDYLIDITKEEESLIGRASVFYHSSNKYNDVIRNFIEKAFKPLVDFITDSLSMEIMMFEPEKRETHIYQNIGNNYPWTLLLFDL